MRYKSDKAWGFKSPHYHSNNEVIVEMAMRLNQKVEFCGCERTFTRCPNKTLKDYQKKIEEIQDELMPLAERTRDFQFKITELNEEMASIDKHIELLEKLEEPSDKEIRECITLTKDKIVISKKIHEIRKENDDAEREDRKFYEELDKKLRESYGEFASKIFENFEKEEIEEADSTDLTIAPRLGDVYRLATTGCKQKDIDKAIQEIIKDSFQ